MFTFYSFIDPNHDNYKYGAYGSGKIIFAGILVVMLLVIIGIIEKTKQQNIPVTNAALGITVGEFNNLVPFTLGRIPLLASIADTDAKRQLGLSNTTEIPDGVAKFFIFDTSEPWGFWMKDMNYPIDIFWLDDNGHVVHIVEEVKPDTYPDTTFAPPVPAKYVIETRAGFAKENNIRVGEVTGMTQILMERQ